MRDYIIVANGDFLVSEIIEEAIQNKIIIALEEAADKLARLGIIPQFILGDFDSGNEAHAKTWGIHTTFVDMKEEDVPYLGHHNVTIVPQKNQQLTDLMKAIHFCDKKSAISITIICALGGRIDHHEAAMRGLRSEYKKERLILLHTEQQTLRFAKNETVVFSGQKGDKCGILAFPQGSFTSQGLEYEVKNFPLEFGYSESIANSLREENATVEIKGEALLVMPPLLNAQREFQHKTEVERLELLLRDAKRE